MLLLEILFGFLVLNFIVQASRKQHIHLLDVGCAVGAGLTFGCGIWMILGGALGSAFLTCYLTEYSLSVDNLIVFVALFRYFAITEKQTQNILHWGIIGAIVLRGIFLFGGAWALSQIHWLMYPLGVFLLWTAYKVITSGDSEDPDFSNTPLAQFLTRHLRFNFDRDNNESEEFWFKSSVGLTFTLSFLVLCLIEVTDIMFAGDSIPASLAVTQDPFVLFTANILAVMGLRSLYFVVNQLIDRLEYLKYGVGVVLAMISAKMLLASILILPNLIWLEMIGGILGLSILLSCLKSLEVRPDGDAN